MRGHLRCFDGAKIEISYFCPIKIIAMTAFDFFNILRSIPKTFRFNLHYFPLKTALKLPVIVSHRTYLRELHGKVELPEKVETAMVKIGFGDVGHYDRKRSRSIWQVSGTSKPTMPVCSSRIRSSRSTA